MSADSLLARRSELDTAQSIAIIADRENEQDLGLITQRLGGSWPLLLACWPKEMQFALAVAGSPARVCRGAPLMIYARDLEQLPEAMQRTCAQLDDIKCAWFLLVSGDAREIVQREVLRDAAPGGSA